MESDVIKCPFYLKCSLLSLIFYCFPSFSCLAFGLFLSKLDVLFIEQMRAVNKKKCFSSSRASGAR